MQNMSTKPVGLTSQMSDQLAICYQSVRYSRTGPWPEFHGTVC